MKREKSIEAFSTVGAFLSQFKTTTTQMISNPLNDTFYEAFSSAIYAAKIHNGWFEEVQVRRAVFSLSEWLTISSLSEWASGYPKVNTPKQIGLVMAGNIPLVGFHDFVCVIVSGNNVLLKLSSDDKILLPLLV